MKKSTLVMMVLAMVFLCVACGSATEKKEAVSIQFIVVTGGNMDMDEISKQITDVLKSADQKVSVEEVKLSKEDRYLVTINTTLTEDEVISILKEETWVQNVSVNYELTMY